MNWHSFSMSSSFFSCASKSVPFSYSCNFFQMRLIEGRALCYPSASVKVDLDESLRTSLISVSCHRLIPCIWKIPWVTPENIRTRPRDRLKRKSILCGPAFTSDILSRSKSPNMKSVQTSLHWKSIIKNTLA